MDLLRPAIFLGGLLGPDKLQNHSNEEEERRKRKNEEEERRRSEKSNGCTLSFHNRGYFGDSFWPKKDCWTQKVHLAVTFSKIRLDVCMGS